MSDTMSLSNCEWKEYTLDELFKIQNGYAFKSNDFIDDSPNTFEVLKMGHIERGGGLRRSPKKDFIPRNPKLYNWVLDKNDIVMAMTDMKDNVVILGVPAIIDKSDHYVLNQRVARLKLINEQSANIYFLYYYLKWDDFLLDLQSKANSGVQVNLTTEIIKQSKVIIPSKSIQDVIASILSSIDDKIDLLHRQNATLEKMSETLFRQWFVHRPELVEGEEAKEEWEMIPLSQMANFLNGLACQKYPPKNEIDKLPVLKIKELSSGITENSDWATTDIKNEYIVRNGDIIFAWSASLMVKIWDGQDCILNQHLFKVTSEDYPKWFYYLWCKHHLAEFISIAASHATTMGHIKRGDLDEALVLIPKSEELSTTTRQVEPIIEKVITNNNQIRTLTALRDTLLPKLMSGEVRVEY